MKKKLLASRTRLLANGTVYLGLILTAGLLLFSAAIMYFRGAESEQLLSTSEELQPAQISTSESFGANEPAMTIDSLAVNDAGTSLTRSRKSPVVTPRLTRRKDLASGLSATNLVDINPLMTDEADPDARRADQPDEARRFRGLQMKDENGEIPIDGLQKARKQIDRMRGFQEEKAKAAGKPEGLEVAAIAPGDWTWLGPGNIGGRIRSIVIDPVNPNNMLVGSVSGGIWRTTNGGVLWAPVDDFMANLAVSSMVIDPTNSNIMYAGTGESLVLVQLERNFLSDTLRGDGVFKSVNGGVTWSQLPQTRSADPTVCGGGGVGCPWSYVNRLALAPDGSTLLAATINGIRFSTDGGATWNLGVGTLNNLFADIDFDPSASQRAVAGGLSIAVYSTDAGQNWIPASFTPNIAANGATGRVELAYAPSNPLIVYASVDQNNVPSGQGAIYRSIDGGRNYNLVNTSINNLLGGQGGYDNIIWVNPQDPNFVIVGGVNLFRSIDAGINWTGIADGANGSAHSDHHMIVAHPGFNNSTNKTAYFSNDGGLYRADDVSTVSPTSGWTELNNNLGITQFYGAAANSAGVIVGGTQDNGTLRYSGDAQNWTSMSGGDGGYAAADPADNNYFYGEYINLGIDRSTNGGASSTYVYCNPVPTNPNGGPCVSPAVGITDAFNGANFIAPFILDPNEPNRLLAGGLSLWRTNDVKNVNPAQNNGLPTWTAIKPPVSNGLIPPSFIPISAIAVSPNNPDFVVVGHNFGDIFLTFDGTGTNPPVTAQCVPGNSPCWVKIDRPGVPNRFVTRLTIDETRSPNWIYATFGGFANNNVYVTKDLGATWTDVSGSGTTALPSVPVRSLVINPIRPNFIYVGTEVGVFASQDAGASWELPQGGPANVSVDELFFNAGRLFAVTHGRGVYKTALSVYDVAACTPVPGCNCQPRWDCPCSWLDGSPPTANDDSGIQCPMTIATDNQGAATARNLYVARGATLTVNNTLGLAGDLQNNGIIDGTSTFASIAARNIVNFRPENAVTTNGTISFAGSINAVGNGLGTAEGDVTNTGDMTFPGSLTAVGTVTNRGVVSIGGDLNAKNLTTFQNSILTLNNTLRLKGDVTNEGSITGNLIALNSSPAGVHNFSGAGVWRFATLPIASSFTVRLGSDVTFDIATLSNNGTLDLQNRTLNFRGMNSFNNANGTVAGTGTFRFAPSDGSVGFGHQGTNFAPAVVVESGAVEFTSGGTINGPFTIDAGATFGINAATLTLGNNATVDGSITNLGATSTLNFNGQLFTNNGSVGNINFLVLNSSGMTLTQTLAGNGSWSPQNIHVGQNPPSNTTVSLANNMSFASSGLTVFNGSTLNVANNTLTLTGPVNFLHPGAVAGSGLVRMQPVSGVPVIGNQFVSNGAFAPSLEIATGAVNLWGMTIDGNLTVNSGASLAMSSFGPTVKGDVLINGNLNAFSGSPIFNFRGTSFINNGAVTGSTLFFGNSDRLYAQSLAGSGTWDGTPNLFVHANSTVTLLSDVTYNGTSLFNDGRIDTGAFTLSLPCTVSWSGAGDVFGNIRRTNLVACPGAAIAYGNPFTTIRFTSGTPPTDITVNVAPLGFPGAVTRTYLITPFGGSAYTATLRLHYLDSELNGNNEASLQLWRKDGANWTPQGVSNRNTTQNWVEYNNVTQFSPWALAELAPTAANVAISGRVITSNGQGIRNARLTLTSPNGTRRTATTSTFGYYAFDGIEVGHTYILEVGSKRFTFANATRIFILHDEITGMDFFADPE